MPNVKKIMTHTTLYKYKKNYTECKMYLQWGISLGVYHTNRSKQEILCWKYKLVYHLSKIRTHWHTKTAKITTYWHTKRAEKDTHSGQRHVPSIHLPQVTPRGVMLSSRILRCTQSLICLTLLSIIM